MATLVYIYIHIHILKSLSLSLYISIYVYNHIYAYVYILYHNISYNNYTHRYEPANERMKNEEWSLRNMSDRSQLVHRGF